MAPLQSTDNKFGANYMPAPMNILSDNERKPSAPSATELDLDIGVHDHNGAGTIPINMDEKRNRQQRRHSSKLPCIGFSIFLVIFFCVITGLEVSFFSVF